MIRGLVLHPGTQHAFRLALELHRRGMLFRLRTGLAVAQGGFWQTAVKWLPSSIRWRFLNRWIDLPVGVVSNHLQAELTWQVRQSIPGPGQSTTHARNMRFQKQVPDTDLARADVVIGFDTSSWIIAERCRDLGTPTVLIQTTVHPDEARSIKEKLASTYPEWTETLQNREPQVRLAEEIEFQKSDRIVCASSYTRRTLVEHGVPNHKIHVIPHGVDLAKFCPAPNRGARPFRFIFVGSLSAQKGVPLLLDAWRQLAPEQAELWLVGLLPRAAKALLDDIAGVRLLGRVANADVPSLMQQCDVFVFPSYFEGFGLVILQAMACGLPIITTSNTAGPDLISRQGQGGWIIPAGDLKPLADAMAYCLAHRQEMRAIGMQARLIAERFSWHEYGNTWADFLEKWVGRHERAPSPAPDAARGHSPHVKKAQGASVLVAHPGTQHSFALAAELHRRRKLRSFHTGFAVADESALHRVLRRLPDRYARPFANRVLSGVPRTRVTLYPAGEIARLLKRRRGKAEVIDIIHQRNLCFQNAVPPDAIAAAEAVIGFDTSSWILAERCRQVGIPFLLDQSTPHRASKLKVFNELLGAWPEWSDNAPLSSREVEAAENIELSLASVIVAASSFTVRTLVENGVSRDRIRLNPYGVNAELFIERQKSAPRPLRFVFVGSLTAAKGLPVLCDAWQRVQSKQAELWLVGPVSQPVRQKLMPLSGVRLFGAVPHAHVAAIMRECDVFVFPSFYEGFGMVILEAMACGLPVIATHATAAPDLIREGGEGWIIPAGDVTALATVITTCLANPSLVSEMGRLGRVTASRFSWAAYGERWCDILDSLTATPS